jgi:hypothetical protein
MSKENDPVSKLFNVKDARVMVFGGTIIDTNDEAGYNETTMTKQAKSPDWSPKAALLAYPNMQNVQEEEKDNMYGMASVWLNGFAPVKKGLYESNVMMKRSSTFLNSSGYVTTDQILKTRQPDKICSLFSCMKWYSSDEKKPPMRLIDKSLASIEGKRAIIELGMSCEKWFEDPISIRYIVRNEAPENSDRGDYVYLIGGSRELLADNLTPVMNEISMLYKTSRAVFDAETQKKNNGDVLKLSNIQSKSGIWLAYDKKRGDEGMNDSQMKLINAMRDRRKLVRLMSGVIYIRNYLRYANELLGEDTILDFDCVKGTTADICKKVPIKEVRAKYEDAYQYCKNLVGVFPDIATCSWA